MPRTATISSSVSPPKYRNSTTLAWRGASCENAARASSTARIDRSGPGDKAAVSSMFTSGARRAYQNPPHHLCGHSEELRPLLPFHLGHVYQAKVDFVDQGSGLQAVAWALVFHIPAGHPEQFRIDPLRESLQSNRVAAAPCFQQTRDFCRAC